MKKLILCLSLLLCSSLLFGQKFGKAEGYASYEEMKNGTPSFVFDLRLRENTKINKLLRGGIINYRIDRIDPEKDRTKVEVGVWALGIYGKQYINAYRYSQVEGFNEIIETGYYSYFVGDPPRDRDIQIEMGLTPPGVNRARKDLEAQPYVIMPDGEVRVLRPEMLLPLCGDNEAIVEKLKTMNIRADDFPGMFAVLKEYNEAKK